MSDSVGHLEQETTACIQSDETRVSTNDDKLAIADRCLGGYDT